MRLLMLAAMPRAFSMRIVKKVSGFPEHERAPSLAEKYKPNPSFRAAR